MIGKQLKTATYRELQAYLSQNAHDSPHCPTYEINIVLNGESYTLFVLLDRHNKIYALYALRSVYEQEANAVRPVLITENVILSALMELMIYQCAT